MWPFTKRKREHPVDANLVERVEALEKRFESVDVEWSEWYDKYRRLYARLAKRVHDDEAKSPPPEGASGAVSRSRSMNPLAEALLKGPRANGGL